MQMHALFKKARESVWLPDKFCLVLFPSFQPNAVRHVHQGFGVFQRCSAKGLHVSKPEGKSGGFLLSTV